MRQKRIIWAIDILEVVDGGSLSCHEQEVGGGGWWMVRGVPCGSLLHCVTSSWSSHCIIELRWLGSAMKNKIIKLKKHTIGQTMHQNASFRPWIYWRWWMVVRRHVMIRFGPWTGGGWWEVPCHMWVVCCIASCWTGHHRAEMAWDIIQIYSTVNQILSESFFCRVGLVTYYKSSIIL